MSEEEVNNILENSPGFIKHNDYKAVKITPEKVILEAKLSENALNPYGYAHGGLIFGLGDTAMGMLAMIDGRQAVTQSAYITYLKPTMGQLVRAEAEQIKAGKTTCFLRCNFYDDKDKLTASMDANYYYIK